LKFNPDFQTYDNFKAWVLLIPVYETAMKQSLSATNPLRAYQSCVASVKASFNSTMTVISNQYNNCKNSLTPCQNQTNQCPTLIPNITAIINQLNALQNQAQNSPIDPACKAAVLADIILLLNQSANINASVYNGGPGSTFSTLTTLITTLQLNVNTVDFNLTQCPPDLSPFYNVTAEAKNNLTILEVNCEIQKEFF
jgi:hypothetical protein